MRTRTVSKYDPPWEHLKYRGELTVFIKVPRDATREYKERRLAILRKGISRRKELDLQFNQDYPSGRLFVKSINWETMEVCIELRNMPYEEFVIPETLSKL